MVSSWFSNADDTKDFKILAEGDYTIQLGAPRNERRGNYDAIIFPFQTEGNSNIVPHEISLLYPTDTTDKTGIDRSRRILAEFYRCFGIDPTKSQAEPSDFYHRFGRVHIGRNGNGYMTVDRFYRAQSLEVLYHNASAHHDDPRDIAESALNY